VRKFRVVWILEELMILPEDPRFEGQWERDTGNRPSGIVAGREPKRDHPCGEDEEPE
jgi:hypothetical protein